MQDKIIFITVGMHRSGTSLVTNCLQTMGLELSKDLVLGSKDNPDGFFEDENIVRFNDLLETQLQRNHLASTCIAEYPKDWQKTSDVLNIKRKIKEYISENIEKIDNWLIKDPRLTRLMPLYLSIFNELNIMPITIFVHRHPASVVRSKSDRDKINPFIVEKHWLMSNLSALNAIYLAKTPIYILSYEDLISQHKETLDALCVYIKRFKPADNRVISYPGIHLEKAAMQLNQDVRKFKVGKDAIKLNEILQKKSGFLEKIYWSEILDFISNYSLVIKNEAVWTDLICSQAQKKNESNKVFHENEKLKRELKVSSGRVFGLRERVDFLSSRLKALNTEHSELLIDFNVLNLRQKTKIYLIAKRVHDIKTLINNRGIRRYRMFIKHAASKLKSTVIVTKRSFNNNGYRITMALIFQKLKDDFGYFFSGKKRQIKAEVVMKNNFEKKRGNEIIRNFGLTLNEQKISIFLNIFVKEFYIQKAGLKVDTDFDIALQHFLETGLHDDVPPGPLFDVDFYRNKALNDVPYDKPIFLHWLEYGVENHIIPTILFDESFYIHRHSLVINDGEWAFERFINISVNNNAAPNQYFESNWYIQNHNIAENDLPPLYHYLIRGYKKGWRPSPLFPAYSRHECQKMPKSPMETLMKVVGFDSYRFRVERSPILLEQISQAAEIEPKILKPDGLRRLNILPINNPNFPAIKSIRNSLLNFQYDSIVLIPHCRYGGAGLVAGQLCRALIEYDNKERVLLIRTDNDDFMRPDWFPKEIEILNLLDFACDVSDEFRMKILLDLLIGLKPRRIFNVHSRLAWEVFANYADRLKRWSSLYGYTFCYDLNAVGMKVGYPINYVPRSIEHLKTLFVDNSYLKFDLVKENGWSESLKSKISVLYTPYQSHPNGKESKIELEWEKDKKSLTRKKIFWAGRFDRQKRFDLVVKLAERNPEFDFWVWGAAMLSDSNSELIIPDNLKLHGLFQTYSELPLESCDLWLYTSQWDGVPTILIELGLRRVPLVASQIWGTVDIINEETAFPVNKVTDIKMYEDAIKMALTNPQQAAARSERLRELILTRHSPENYLDSLKEHIFNDKWVENK